MVESTGMRQVLQLSPVVEKAVESQRNRYSEDSFDFFKHLSGVMDEESAKAKPVSGVSTKAVPNETKERRKRRRRLTDKDAKNRRSSDRWYQRRKGDRWPERRRSDKKYLRRTSDRAYRKARKDTPDVSRRGGGENPPSTPEGGSRPGGSLIDVVV